VTAGAVALPRVGSCSRPSIRRQCRQYCRRRFASSSAARDHRPSRTHSRQLSAGRLFPWGPPGRKRPPSYSAKRTHTYTLVANASGIPRHPSPWRRQRGSTLRDSTGRRSGMGVGTSSYPTYSSRIRHARDCSSMRFAHSAPRRAAKAGAAP
jgi:hypothetical protein